MALNLTCANRLILVDQWWNGFVEAQAFSRSHRVGQVKETYFAKISARNTIDERLHDLQVEKGKRISATLGEDGAKRPPLTIEEMKRLMGFGEEDPAEKDGKEDGEEDGEEELAVGSEDGASRQGAQPPSQSAEPEDEATARERRRERLQALAELQWGSDNSEGSDEE